jgi:hypothetical protein
MGLRGYKTCVYRGEGVNRIEENVFIVQMLRNIWKEYRKYSQS